MPAACTPPSAGLGWKKKPASPEAPAAKSTPLTTVTPLTGATAVPNTPARRARTRTATPPTVFRGRSTELFHRKTWGLPAADVATALTPAGSPASASAVPAWVQVPVSWKTPKASMLPYSHSTSAGRPWGCCTV